ncbi:MAG: hypothetical protein DRO05_01395 [Thermoproteota archaeon]|nr:MAG: hypothetical protein DRO05_01395 [Candidatus Korarchaeota archaeon]
MRFIQLFSLGLTWSQVKAVELVARSGVSSYSEDMKRIFLASSIEGHSLSKELNDFCDRLKYKPLGAAIKSLLQGADSQDIVNTLKKFIRTEIEFENREIDRKLAIRLSMAFLTMMLLASASALGTIPPSLLYPISILVLVISAFRFVIRRFMLWKMNQKRL